MIDTEINIGEKEESLTPISLDEKSIDLCGDFLTDDEPSTMSSVFNLQGEQTIFFLLRN